MAAVASLGSNAIGIYPAGLHGSQPAMQGRAGASETWALGAVLIRNAGQIDEAAADPVADVIGIAASAVTSSTADDLVPFWPWLPGTMWSGTFDDQATTGHALVTADILVDYGLQVDDDGIWYVDQNETTNTSVTIWSPVDDADIVNATVRARVLFTPILDVMVVDT